NGTGIRTIAASKGTVTYYPFSLAWSPDGRFVITLRQVMDNERYRDLVAIEVATGKVMPIGTQRWADTQSRNAIASLPGANGILVTGSPLPARSGTQVWF